MVVLVRFFNIGKYFNIYRLILKQSYYMKFKNGDIIPIAQNLPFSVYNLVIFLVDSQSHTTITTT